MALITRVLKRVIIGRPMSSEAAGHTLLAKRLALPIFASDALSSVAYATQEIMLVLTVGGVSFLYLAPWVAGAVVVLMAAVVASYRQLVRAYPTGGGDYEVASKNIGRSAGVVVASALLVDYVMTVAVSVSSGVDNIISAVPSLSDRRVVMAVVFVALLAAVNLRGLREAGLAFAAPTYLFATGVFIMIGTGLFRAIAGDAPVAESAKYHIETQHGYGSLGFFALMFFTLRAFSSGCTALTGVEAIANGVPAFKPPKARNAQLTLVAMGAIAVSMFIGHHRAGADHQGAHHRPDQHELPFQQHRPLRRQAAAHGHRPGGERGVRRPALGRLLLHPGHDGPDPRARRQHGVQRLPPARLDPGAGQEPAGPAQQPR